MRSCCRAPCCETPAASYGTMVNASCASPTQPATRSVPSPSRRIAHKGRLRGAREVLAMRARTLSDEGADPPPQPSAVQHPRELIRRGLPDYR